MAEVGVLQLTVEDNSESAAKGLGHLADVLERVRNAVGSGLGLEGTSNEIEKIAKVVNDAISGSTIAKLGQFADALKGLKGINLKSVANAMQGFDQGTAIENTKDRVNALSTEFTKAWTAMNTFYTKYAEIKSLVAGTNTPLLGSGGVAPENALSTQVWTGPNWSPDWTHGENFSTGWTSDIGKVREDAIEVEGTVTDAMEGTAQAVSGAADAISDGMTVVSGAMEGAAGSAGTVTDGMVEVEASVEDATGSAHRFADALDFIKTKAKGAWSSLWKTRDGVNGLKGAFSAMFPTLSTFLSGMGRIVKYRLIRTIIKEITSGMSEGIQNVYHYSKAIGSSFAPAMDDAATALLQMKNSIGAALAPMIQSLIPYLQTIVNWFITLINYVNQFISLLRGQQTWTRAVPKTTQAFDDQTKAAKRAGAAIKDLLADWDELNIIQSESGGGGGGAGTSAAEDYLSMFEEVGEYEGWIKDLVDGINDQFGDIWGLVKKIGLAILGWKLSSAFAGWLGKLGGLLSAAMIVDLVFNITQLLDKQYFKTGDIGWVVADVLQTALGAYLANQVVGKVLGAGAGKVSAGVTLAVSAVADIIALAGATDVDALSTEGIITAIKSGLKLGGGFMLFSMAAGVPTAEAIVYSGGVASIGIGAAIAIKAVAEAAQTGEITFDTVKKGVAGAVAALLGVTVFEMIGGATFGAAIAAGGAAALAIGAGFAVALGIVAMIGKDNVEWGEISLTDAEVQAFVDKKMFTVSIPTTVKIIDDSLKDISADRESIETTLSTALGTLNVIKLGVANDNDYEQLAKDILGDEKDGSGGLVGTVQKYINDAKQQGKLTLQFTPSLVGSDTADASEWFSNYTTGWDTVNTFVAEKGAEIGRLLTTEEGKEIIKSKPEVLAALMEQVEDVTNAITGAQISSEAFANLSVSIGDVDYATGQKIIDAYSDYLNQIREKEKELIKQQYASQGELVAGLIAMGADPEKDPLKTALGKYDYMGQHINDAIEESVENASRPGAIMIADLLKKRYQDAFTGFDLDLDNLGYLSGIQNNAYALPEMNDLLTDWLRINNRELGETLQKTGIYAWNVLEDDTKARLMEAMKAAFGETATDELIQKWENQTKDAIKEASEQATPVDLTVPANVVVDETIETVTEDVYDGTSELPTGGQAAVEEYQAQAAALTETAAEVEREVNTLTLDKLTFNTTDAQNSASQAAFAIEDMANRIRIAFQSIDGIGFTFTAGDESVMAKLHAVIPVIPAAASGAVFKSGDIFSANENGKTELIGSYGNKTAVMNNDQVVGAVTNGVAQANSGVEDRLTAIENRLIAIMNKEWIAKAEPSSRWGQHAQESADAYSRVTG